MTTRIILVDDHAMVRSGFASLLRDIDGLEVVAEADDGHQAVRLTMEHQPDVVIVDINMPEMNGVETIRQIKAQMPGVKVITLSMHKDARFMASVFEAGSQGYVLKECAFEELKHAISAVEAGHMYLSPQVCGILIEDYLAQRSGVHNRPMDALTVRQREVLRMMANGQSTREIADGLGLSIKTIETHRQHIMGKLDAHSVAELTKIAIREGLTTIE